MLGGGDWHHRDTNTSELRAHREILGTIGRQSGLPLRTRSLKPESVGKVLGNCSC